MASRITPLLPLTILQGIRRHHSEISDQGQTAGNGFSLPLWSIWSVFVAWVFYTAGRKQGVEDLTVQLPEAKISAEREALRKEEETLKYKPGKFTGRHHCRKFECTFDVRHDMSQKKRTALAEKVEALDMKELEHLKQRAITLEEDIETQRNSIEADRADESPLEDVKAIFFRSKPSDMPPYPYLCEEEGTTFECPLCSGQVADPRTRRASISPSINVVPQAANQELYFNNMPKSLPPQDKSTPYTKPDTDLSQTPKTNTGQTPASTVDLETLSAETDATDDEMSQIKQAKETLTTREKGLEAKSKDRKKRIQALNAPKSDQTWPVVQGMLFGSALAFGVMTSIFRS